MLGLLMTVAFLGHDVTMATAATGDTTFIAPAPRSTAHAGIVHVIAAGDLVHAGHDHSSRDQCAGDACPVQSRCGLTRDAVPSGSDLLLLTMHAMTGEIDPIGVWCAAPHRHSFADAPPPSPRDQRIMRQVILI